jgi:glycerol kinase
MAEGGQDRFREQTGLPIATYFSGPKIKWILDNVPEARHGGGKGGCPFRHHRNLDDLVADRRPAPGRACHRCHQCQPHPDDEPENAGMGTDILKTLGIPPQMLPRIVPSVDRETWGYTFRTVP